MGYGRQRRRATERINQLEANQFRRPQPFPGIAVNSRVRSCAMGDTKVRDIKPEIAAELYVAFKKLGAKPDLLRIIGSYGETMDDYWVLGMLKQWNAGKS